MGSDTRVSVVIVSYNTIELTLRAVRSVVEGVSDDVEVVVVDNASEDGSMEALRGRYPSVKIIELDENVGFGRANNVGMEAAKGRYFLLLNSDAYLRAPEDLDALTAMMEGESDVGVVGCRLVGEEGRLQYSARSFPSILGEFLRIPGVVRWLPFARQIVLGDTWPHDSARGVPWVVGACMLVRREVFETVGGFDPAIFMYGEEMEWCWRIGRTGWQIRFDPSVTVIHKGRGSGCADPRPRVRRSLEGDARFVVRSRGRGYYAFFYPTRLVLLASKAVLTGLASLIFSRVDLSGRSRQARLELGIWAGFTFRRWR